MGDWCAVDIRWPLKRNASKSNEKKHTMPYPITLVRHGKATKCDCVLVDVQHNDLNHQTRNAEYIIICFIFVVMVVMLRCDALDVADSTVSRIDKGKLYFRFRGQN